MLTVGEILRQKREEKGLSIKTVVDHTYIQAKFVIALECNDYTVFPAEAYTRGFLRNYAEMLGLDTSEMLELFKRTKDTVTPNYDHEYYKTAMGLEPELQKVEDIELRKAAIEEARAADESMIDSIQMVKHKVQSFEPIEQLESEITVDEAIADQQSEISVTNNDEQSIIEPAIEEITVELELEPASFENIEQEQADIEQPDKDKTVQVAAKSAIPLDRDGYPQPPSFRQKLVESRSNNSSNKKWIVIGVAIVLIVAAWFIMSNQHSDPQTATNNNALSVFKQANGSQKPPVQTTIELSGKVATRCWVSVVADGKTIFEDNLQPDSSFKWQAKDNLKVTIGNVSALAELRLNGKPTNLGEVRSNVAERTFTLKDVQ